METSEMMEYKFFALRYIHDAVTGEFANVGVVLYSGNARVLSRNFSAQRTRFARLVRKSFWSLIQPRSAACTLKARLRRLHKVHAGEDFPEARVGAPGVDKTTIRGGIFKARSTSRPSFPPCSAMRRS